MSLGHGGGGHHHGGGGGRGWGGGGWWGGGHGWGYGGPIILTYPFPDGVVTTDEMGIVPVDQTAAFELNGMRGLGDPMISSNVLSFAGAAIGAHFGSQKKHPMIGAAVGYIAGVALGNILGR